MKLKDLVHLLAKESREHRDEDDVDGEKLMHRLLNNEDADEYDRYIKITHAAVDMGILHPRVAYTCIFQLGMRYQEYKLLSEGRGD